MESIAAFEGSWVDEDGEVLQVEGGVLLGPDGKPVPLFASGPDACRFSLDGQNFEGRLEAGGQRLLWSDGVAWTRQERQQEQPAPVEQPSKRAAGQAQALTFEQAANLGAKLRVVSEATHVLRACREAAIDPPQEDLWQAAAGHSVTVLATDPIDATLECRVPGVGDVWLPVTALLPALEGEQLAALGAGEQTSQDTQINHEQVVASSQDLAEGPTTGGLAEAEEEDHVEEEVPPEKEEEPWTGWDWETGEEPCEEEGEEDEPHGQLGREAVSSQAQGWFEERSERLWRELRELEACKPAEQRRRLRALQLELHPDKQPVETRAKAQQLFLIVQTEWEAAQKGLASEKQRKEQEQEEKRRTEEQRAREAAERQQRQSEAQRQRDDTAFAKEQRRREEEQRQKAEEEEEDVDEEAEDVSQWNQARYKEAAAAFKLREKERLRQEEELRKSSGRLTYPGTAVVEVAIFDPTSEEHVLGRPLYILKNAKLSWLVCDVKQEIESLGRIPRVSQRLSLLSPTETQRTTEGEVEDTEPLSSLTSRPSLQLTLFVSPHMYEDYVYMLKAVQRNWRMLQWAPLSLRSDRTIIRTAVCQSWQALRHASRELRKDWMLVYKAVKQDGAALEFAAGNLSGNRPLVLTALRRNWKALGFASQELRGDSELVLRAMQQDVNALQFAAPELLKSSEFFLAAADQNPAALRYASASICADRKLFLAVVKRNPMALQYASPRLKADKELVMAALQKDPCVLEHVAPILRSDKKVLAACRGNWNALKHVDGQVKGNAEAELWKASLPKFDMDAYRATLFGGRGPQGFFT